MPFEFDVRVPFYVRGPMVPAGVKYAIFNIISNKFTILYLNRINGIVLNIDLAPTFLDIAGVSVPDDVDGKSVFPLIKESYEFTKRFNSSQGHEKIQWRDTFLIERGYINY